MMGGERGEVRSLRVWPLGEGAPIRRAKASGPAERDDSERQRFELSPKPDTVNHPWPRHLRPILGPRPYPREDVLIVHS